MSSDELPDDIESLKNLLKSERESHEDLRILHENVVEHGTSVENELDKQNSLNNTFLDSMRRYLSPQLFNLITGKDLSNQIAHQRRRVTIFFSDIVNFTSITDNVEPEVLSSCLNFYLDKMSKIAIHYDGTIDKFIGDAIMVFFDDPSGQKDIESMVKSCVSMSIDMQENMKEVNQFWRKHGVYDEVKIRIGVNSGYVTIGNFGAEERVEYTIMGSQVNIASRLEGIAKPGKIVVSLAIKVLTDDIVEYKHLGEISVKGVHTPVDVFEVVGRKKGSVLSLPPSITFADDGTFTMSSFVYGSKIYTSGAKDTLFKNLVRAAKVVRDDVYNNGSK